MYYHRSDPRSPDQMWQRECASVAGFCVGKGLDPGAGNRTLDDQAVRMDLFEDLTPQVRGSAPQLPFKDSSFDYLFNSHLLEHMERPADVLREWLRVVKPGGVVACVIPNTAYTHGQNTDRTPHRYEWTPREFLMQVIKPIPMPGVWFEYKGHAPYIGPGVLVEQVTEACPQWSFNVVLRRGQ